MSDVAALVSDNLDIWTGAIERKSGAGRGSGSKRISLYGIERLRALILDLAVRGKLVPQDHSDEPASKLLVRIAAEQASSTRSKRGQKSREGVEALSDISDFPAPSGWQVVPLFEVATVIRGVTYSKSDASDDERAGLIALLRAHNIQSEINLEKLVYVPSEKVSSDQVLKLGDIVVAMSSGSADLVGKAARYGFKREASFGAFCGVIRPLFECIQPYLAFFCQTPFYRNQTHKGGKGIGIQNLSKGDLEKLTCPIPPLAEQRRIVAKVDELMALCDALERESADAMAAHQTLVEALLATLVNSADAVDLAANWARLESHFDTLFTTEASIEALKQTILDLAVRGKLVDQDAANWPVEPLGKYVKEAAAGWSPKCIEAPRSGDNWGVLKVSAVTWGRFQPEENKELPPSLEPRPEIEVAPGDFLISRANTAELVARSVVVPLNAPRKLMMSDKIIRFRFNDKIDPAYVNLVHASPFARAYYARVAGGTSSSMKNVSQSQIRALEIPIPPLAEQHRIVAKVDELMALCDVLKARLSDAAETRRHLADAIVERAAA